MIVLVFFLVAFILFLIAAIQSPSSITAWAFAVFSLAFVFIHWAGRAIH